MCELCECRGFAIVHNVINVINILIFLSAAWRDDGPHKNLFLNFRFYYFYGFNEDIALPLPNPIEIGNFAWPLPRCWATRTTLHQRQPNDFSSYQNERETNAVWPYGVCGDWWEVSVPFLVPKCVKYWNKCRKQNKSQFSCLIFLLIFHFSFSFIDWEYILWLYLSSLFRFKIRKYFWPFVLSWSQYWVSRVGNLQWHESRPDSILLFFAFYELWTERVNSILFLSVHLQNLFQF